jgi:hypothetical protein
MIVCDHCGKKAENEFMNFEFETRVGKRNLRVEVSIFPSCRRRKGVRRRRGWRRLGAEPLHICPVCMKKLLKKAL